MQVLIVGNGGREHALTWKVTTSPQVKKIFVAPGNAGTCKEPKTTNIPIAATNIEKLVQFCRQQPIDLVIVGPEIPLSLGLTDALSAENIRCFGPSQKAAQLESSKLFAKQFMQRYGIPSPAFARFTKQTVDQAIAYATSQPLPLVIKANGLAAGKGVVVAHSYKHATEAIYHFLSQKTQGSGEACILIEEHLSGQEVSFIAMVHGNTIIPLATAQDHKARDNGDRGPNTGGMGAYSPAPIVDADLMQYILQHIIYPTIDGLQQEGIIYSGFLYAGLMITADGTPQVLEFNCRLGDPETQVLLMRLNHDLFALCMALLTQSNPKSIPINSNRFTIDWDQRSALGVVLAAQGYPEAYTSGTQITTMPTIIPNAVKLFHAGTQYNKQEQLITNGGRVLCVSALGETLLAAQKTAYRCVKQIDWQGIYYRTDIGHHALHIKK